MAQAMKTIKVGDKVRHTFSTEFVGTVVDVRNDPNGYDTKVVFHSVLDGEMRADWYKNDVLFFDSVEEPKS